MKHFDDSLFPCDSSPRETRGQAARATWHMRYQDPYRRLALAVVIQAATEWREKGAIDALVFLWQDAPDFLEATGAGLPEGAWFAWLTAGCPAKARGGRKRKVTECPTI